MGRACGEPTGIELPPVGVKVNGSLGVPLTPVPVLHVPWCRPGKVGGPPLTSAHPSSTENATTQYLPHRMQRDVYFP